MSSDRLAKPEYTPAPVPTDYWPEAGQAMAYLTRVQKLLTARGLTGAERKLKPLMKKVAEAFQSQNLPAVAAACDAVFDAVESGPQKT